MAGKHSPGEEMIDSIIAITGVIIVTGVLFGQVMAMREERKQEKK
jgi:uncharacterized integral membrane protein